MSARLVWIVTCEICEKPDEFDGMLDYLKLGDALRASGWGLPVYGGTFCGRCYATTQKLSGSTTTERNTTE